MKQANKFVPFLLSTAGAWMCVSAFSGWFFPDPARSLFSNGFVALAVLAVLGVLFVTLIQWLVWGMFNYFLWALSTAVGLGLGSVGAWTAFIAVNAMPSGPGGGFPLGAWLAWPAVVFAAVGIGGAPGGLLAGPLKKMAVGQGRIAGWVGVSLANWGLSYGLLGVLALVFLFPDYFFLSITAVRNMPGWIRGGMLGALCGLVQGTVLGWRLLRLKGGGEVPDQSILTDDELEQRLEFGTRPD